MSPPGTPAKPTELNEIALEQLVGRMVGDLGAVISGALVVLGDRLGLYAGLAQVGPVTSTQLAQHTGLDERYVREWLAQQAAGEGRLRQVMSEAGFTRFRRATETPFTLILEVKP